MFLPALIFFTAIWRLGDATSCTALTGNTCQKTNYLTGTCTNAVCACIEGFEPTRFGCVEKVKPVVTITASDGRSQEATSRGSGEVFVGGKINLNCVSSRTGMTYVWSKDNVVLPGQTIENLTLSSVNATHSGQYRCRARLDISDYMSDLSEPVTVKVVPVNGTFGSQPVVTGMPKRAMLNSAISLECTNTPSGIGLTYEWFLGGAITNIRTRGYTLTATNQTVAKNVTCRIGQAPPVVNAGLASPESVPVDTPSSLTDDISGVNILQARGATSMRGEVGFDVNLQCAISDTDLAIPDLIMTYKWTKNGTDISQTNPYQIKLTAADSGVYQCSAKAGARPAKASASVSLEVVPVKGIVGSVTTEVVPAGATPLLGGYMSIKCIVEVANLTKLNYLWAKTEAGFISQQRDGQIQVNEVTSKDSGSYRCLVSTELIWGQSDFVVIKPPVAIDTVAPNAPTADKSDRDSFGVGNTYTLTCGSIYDSPGLTYRWMEGNLVIAGATSKTYTLRAKSGVTLYSCQIVFNGTASKSSPSLTIAAKNIIGATIELAGTTVSGSTIKPLTATKVTLECKAKTAVSSSASVDYAWLKNDQSLQNQTASTYQFTAGAASDGDIKCNVSSGSNETILSDKVTVTSAAALEAPTLEVSNITLFSGQQVYNEGGTYTLLCKTASHTDGVSYFWLKNGTVIGGSTGRSYTISNARRGTDGDSGVYTCTANQGTSTTTSNPGITIAIGEPGRPCKFVTDCLGVQYGPSCVNSRCECSSGYTASGDTCNCKFAGLNRKLEPIDLRGKRTLCHWCVTFGA